MPPEFSHMPPEARIWLATIILAPPVPRKVIISPDGLLFSTTDVTIEQGDTFYNRCLSFKGGTGYIREVSPLFNSSYSGVVIREL